LFDRRGDAWAEDGILEASGRGSRSGWMQEQPSEETEEDQDDGGEGEGGATAGLKPERLRIVGVGEAPLGVGR
jgi:hypothetical protein